MVPAEGERWALNLYSGTPGTILFLLELHHASGNPLYLKEAQEGASLLTGAYLDAGPWLEDAGSSPEDPAVMDPGLYTGQAGAAFVLAETFRAGGGDGYRSGAESLFHAIMASAKKDGEGWAWYGHAPEAASLDIISGSAGIGLGLLYAHDHLQLPGALEGAVEVGRYLVVVTAYYRLTGDDLWLETGKQIVEGLRGTALEIEDYAYHPKWYFALGERATPDMVNEERYVAHLHGAGWVLDGLGKFYQATGHEPARGLGEKLSRYLVKRLSTVDNRHWHTNSQSLIGILELAMATGDQRAMAFAEEHFEFLKRWGTHRG